MTDPESPPFPSDVYEHAFADLRSRCDAARGRKQVLIVDDDPTVAFALRELIRLQCPCAAVTSMTDPAAAMQAVTTGAWAVVIADVNLKSKITGGSLAEAAHRTTDVFFFTGHDEDLTETERALRVAATLRKPLSSRDEKRLVDFINDRVGNRISDIDLRRSSTPTPTPVPVPRMLGVE